MSSQSDPRRFVMRLGVGAVLALTTVTVGLASSSYAVSGINPIYFAGRGSVVPTPTIESGTIAEASTPTATTFPSAPGGQYYYYRPPLVTASYDARTPDSDAAFDSAPEKPARAGRVEKAVVSEPAADDEPTAETSGAAPVEEGVAKPAEGSYAAVRVPPDQNE